MEIKLIIFIMKLKMQRQSKNKKTPILLKEMHLKRIMGG
jgi:hypothetical protein